MNSLGYEKMRLLTCPVCGSELHPVEGRPIPASRFSDCLRRCEVCGVGFSNSSSNQTRIYRDPLHNIPEQVRAGVEEALSNALNERNRQSKHSKFGFSTSEDALTWTVFTFLRMSGQLGSVLRNTGLVGDIAVAPEMLVWGVPQPLESQEGSVIRERLIRICDRLGEEPRSRSEPDVIIVGIFGVVFIEVKYRSPNDQQAFSTKHDKYLEGTDAFSDPQLIRDSRMYELARNWRIGVELAEGTPFTLVNLLIGNRESQELADFDAGLNHHKGQFEVVTWVDLLDQVEAPDWLEMYMSRIF